MRWGIIGTWKMALEGIVLASKLLENGISSQEAVVSAIREVENNPLFTSVGLGGLPNEEGEVELDAAFMNGDNFNIGGVAALTNYKNPIEVAEKLSHRRFNNLLVGEGANKYVENNGFKTSRLLTVDSSEMWKLKCEEISNNKDLDCYDGHDTVGVVALSKDSQICTGTSTSGLFMKKKGRVGDSPLIGSGLYADSDIAGASVTGLGEDIMKCCLSYQVVSLIERGYSPSCAAQMTMDKYISILNKKRGNARAASIICMNKEGDWGVASNVDFSFVVATNKQKAKVYTAKVVNGKTTIQAI